MVSSNKITDPSIVGTYYLETIIGLFIQHVMNRVVSKSQHSDYIFSLLVFRPSMKQALLGHGYLNWPESPLFPESQGER